MALIDCTECGHQVSDLATVCPGCGAPVSSESSGSGATLVTIQSTSKALKKQELMAVAVLVIGFVPLFVAIADDDTGGAQWIIGTTLMLIGGGWWAITRMRIWWHHD